MKKQAFYWIGEPIWDARIQSIWIVFSASYALIGNIYQERWFSSLAITLAGILILFLAVHNLSATDRNKARGTLLVSLAGCLFLVHESYRTYHDEIGSVFSIIFAIVITVLIWMEDESPSRLRITYSFVLLMLATLTFSLFCLLSTVFARSISALFSSDQMNFIIPHHVMGMLAGMSAFLINDRKIMHLKIGVVVPHFLPKYEMFRTILFPFISVILVWWFNYEAVDKVFRNSLYSFILIEIEFTIYFLTIYITILILIKSNAYVMFILGALTCLSSAFSLFVAEYLALWVVGLGDIEVSTLAFNQHLIATVALAASTFSTIYIISRLKLAPQSI